MPKRSGGLTVSAILRTNGWWLGRSLDSAMHREARTRSRMTGCMPVRLCRGVGVRAVASFAGNLVEKVEQVVGVTLPLRTNSLTDPKVCRVALVGPGLAAPSWTLARLALCEMCWLASSVVSTVLRVSVDEVLTWVSEQHGIPYALVNRLAGGFQSGAYLVEAPGRGRAVLKWSQNRNWAEQVVRADDVVRAVRERGYPTPAWLAAGVTGQGLPYQVQEFVDGNPLPALDGQAADLLLALIDRQAGMDPDPGRNWSEYARGVVFGDARQRLRTSGEAGAVVVDAFDRLCRHLVDITLPAGDMVHGDFSLENVLVRDGQVSGVVDIEAIGSGSRVFDLAAVIRSAYLHDAEASGLARVHQVAENIAGPDVLRIFAAATLYDILIFGLEHWDDGIDAAVPAALQLAADL